MKRIVLVAAMACSPAYGETVAQKFERVSQCADQHENDLDRLACYDEAVGRAPAEERALRHNLAWVNMDRTDELTRSKILTSAVISQNSPGCSGEDAASLMLQCKDRALRVVVSSGCFTPGRLSDRSISVKFRTEASDIEKMSMVSSDNGRFFGIWDTWSSTRFLKKLIGAKELVIEYPTYNDGNRTAVFDIAGWEDERFRMAEACPAKN